VSKSAKRICESQEAVFELKERSEFREKGDLQLACKAIKKGTRLLSYFCVRIKELANNW
jgi:hypothetical protein